MQGGHPHAVPTASLTRTHVVSLSSLPPSGSTMQDGGASVQEQRGDDNSFLGKANGSTGTRSSPNQAWKCKAEEPAFPACEMTPGSNQVLASSASAPSNNSNSNTNKTNNNNWRNNEKHSIDHNTGSSLCEGKRAEGPAGGDETIGHGSLFPRASASAYPPPAASTSKTASAHPPPPISSSPEATSRVAPFPPAANVPTTTAASSPSPDVPPPSPHPPQATPTPTSTSLADTDAPPDLPVSAPGPSSCPTSAFLPPLEGFVSLARRRELMDLTIARLKEEMEDVRCRGMESALLQFYGESAVAARLQALREASQHRAHMEGVSARLAEHGKEEAEDLLLGQTEVLKESLIEERAGDLKSCQEELRAAQGGGGGGALPARTVLTRHLRKNKGGGDLWEDEEGSRGGGGRNGNGIGGNGGGYKRRRGPGVVHATFQRLLEEDEAEEDLHAIAEDDRFALEEMEGVGMGREAAMPVEVRIEKSGVYYDGMHLQKNDALVVTNARLRDSFLATLQSFNQTEIFVKVQGKALMPGDTLASSRKRISVEELKATKYVLGLPSSSPSSSPASSPSHFYGGYQGTMPSSFAVAVGGDGSGRARGGGGRRGVR